MMVVRSSNHSGDDEDVHLRAIIKLAEEPGLQLDLLVDTIDGSERPVGFALIAGFLEDIKARGVDGLQLPYYIERLVLIDCTFSLNQ